MYNFLDWLWSPTGIIVLLVVLNIVTIIIQCVLPEKRKRTLQ